MRTTVAIVDDFKLFREALVAMIKTWTDYEVLYVASNGRELLDQLQHSDQIPNLVLVDLHMPELDGFQTTACLRNLYPTARVLIFTISDHEEDRTRALLEGARGYLVKGIPLSQIRQAMDDIMRQS